MIAGKFYAVGDYVQVYDPATNRWTRKPRPQLPAVQRGSNGDAVPDQHRGRRLEVERDRLGGAIAVTVSYDPATDTWTRRADLPSARYGMAASKIFVNGLPRLEVVGGPRPGNNLQYIP